MKLSLKRAALAALVITPLALTACTQGGSSDNTSSPASAAETTNSQPDTTQDSAAENTSPAAEAANPAVNDGDARPVAEPKSEYLIQATKSVQDRTGYDKVSPACQATAVRLTLVVVGAMAPMLEEAQPGTVQKVKDGFAEVQGTTPKEFDAAFSKLEARIDQGSATPDTAGLEQDGAAITNYLETSCKELGTVG